MRGWFAVDTSVSVVLTVPLVLMLPAKEWPVPVRLAVFALIVTGVPALVCIASVFIQRATTPKSIDARWAPAE